MTLSAVVVSGATCIYTGSLLSIFNANLIIPFSNVAENNELCLFSGKCSKTLSISSLKPISNSLSAPGYGGNVIKQDLLKLTI